MFRFWNQFESEIGKAEISPVSKFSYFRSEKELLIPRVRLPIDELPFTSEGYSRAKSISLGKFSKSTEIQLYSVYYLTACYSKKKKKTAKESTIHQSVTKQPQLC